MEDEAVGQIKWMEARIKEVREGSELGGGSWWIGWW